MGRAASGHERHADEAYDTIDERCCNALVECCPEIRERPIWEPAAGASVLAAQLERHGCSVPWRSDLAPRCPQVLPVDFFRVPVQATSACRSIVTNPPYGRQGLLGTRFARHAVALMQPAQGRVALLYQLDWVGAKSRTDLLDHPALDTVVVLRFRPYWIAPEPGERAAPTANYAWVVWDWARTPGPARFMTWTPS